MARLILWVPLGIFLLFVMTVAVGLSSPSDGAIRSRLVGKPVPSLSLPPALPGRQGIESADFVQGEPRILNVFASWCGPCVAEAPRLLALEAQGLPIDGIAIRDRPEDVANFLARSGDPYQRIGADIDSRAQLALGSSGVPETFVIDRYGVIRYQHMGMLGPEHVADIVQAYRAAQ